MEYYSAIKRNEIPAFLATWMNLEIIILSEVTAQKLPCQRSTFMGLESDPMYTFNWTTDNVEICDNGALCQETVLMIRSGRTETAILATKGCSSEGTPAITFIQHSPPPGIVTISYNNYCDDPLCNNRENLYEIWPEPATLHCPTCVALGNCLSAPSLPCPNDTNRCYQGKLQVTGGGINSPLEIKGCTAITGCRIMSGIFTIGPLWVKETCPFKSLTPRKVQSGAMWLPTSYWSLELPLLLLLPLLVH
uniref:UPAR/Ly6 domain-containing protein n=1 Tax=Sus scrofa TaxID=9823 RepID=A0A8D0NUS3_PIG